MVIECDQEVPQDSIRWLEHLEGIRKVTYLCMDTGKTADQTGKAQGQIEPPLADVKNGYPGKLGMKER